MHDLRKLWPGESGGWQLGPTSRTSLSTLSPLQHQMDLPAALFEEPSLVCTPANVTRPPSAVATQMGGVEKVVAGGTVCDQVGLFVDTCNPKRRHSCQLSMLQLWGRSCPADGKPRAGPSHKSRTVSSVSSRFSSKLNLLGPPVRGLAELSASCLRSERRSTYVVPPDTLSVYSYCDLVGR